MSSVRNYRIAIVLVAIWPFCATQAADFADTGTVEPDKGMDSTGHTIKHTRLENGLLVTVYSDSRMPVVTTYLSYHVGSGHEHPQLRGLAHLFEHLMFGATKDREKGELTRYISRHGGSWNAYTSFDETVYWSRIAPEHYETIFLMEADRMMNLELTQEALDTEKRIVIEELTTSENDPFSRVFYAGLKAALGTHPYAIGPAGTEEDIQKTSLGDCRDFYSRYYGPQNAHVIVVGPIPVESAYQAIENHFGTLPRRGNNPPQIPKITEWSFPDEVILKEDLPPVKGSSLGFPFPASDSPDRIPIRLMLHLLQGVDGFEDEIVRRRKKAMYAELSSVSARRGKFVLFTSVSLPYQRKAQAYKNLEEALQQLAEYRWLNSDALEGAKKILVRRHYQGRLTSDSIASRLHRANLWSGDVMAILTFPKRVAAVEIDDIKRVYEKYILYGTSTRFHVVPERIPWYVHIFGRPIGLAHRLGIVRWP